MSEFSLPAFLVFSLAFLSIFTLLHFWVYRSLCNILPPRTPWNGKIVRRCLGVMFVLLDLPWLYFYFYRFSAAPIFSPMIWVYKYPFAIWQTVLLFWGVVLLLYTPVKKTVQGIKFLLKKVIPQKVIKAPPVDFSRRLFVRTSAVGLTGYAMGTTVMSALDRENYEVNERRIAIPNLPQEFNGFTIGLMSDIHSGIFQDSKFLEKYASLVNNLKCDTIVLPGDYVNTLNREIYPFAEAFSSLRAPSGVFGCTGNHDYFANADLICRESEQAGIRMLRNENIAIQRGNAKIYLLGVDDNIIGKNEPERFISTGKSETLEATFKGIPNDATKILLCHRPYPFEEFAQCDVSLMLSGHTHGGQVALANFGNWNISFASLVSKYVQGHYHSTKNPSSQMYVSRGIGTVGLPIRVNCPPEVTKIVLVKA